ncbi:MAG: hypothetical protein J6P16_02115, partial [Eubacterium sp.]|nr:hypothetical protein [Eubacterium sp.]
LTMPGKIKLERASESVSTNSHTVRLENPDVMNYYVSAYGRFTKSYEDVKQAISEADKQMGVVISGDHKVGGERSGAFNQNNLGDLSIIKAKGSVTSLGACVAMVLSRISDVDVSAEELSSSGLTAFEMMEQYIPYPLNLGGCTLDQVIYFVSSNKPVIAMTVDGKGVVIGGYTLNDLTIFDPDMGVRNVSRTEFEKFFKRNGNRFLSYME